MHILLRTAGKLRQFRGDADGIARAFQALPRAGTATLEVTLLDLLAMPLGLPIPVFAIGTAIVLAARPTLA